MTPKASSREAFKRRGIPHNYRTGLLRSARNDIEFMPEPLRLSVAEAAKFFGVESMTIRRAIGAGKLHYVVIRGRYKIDFESLLKWSQSKLKIANKLEQNGVGQFVDKWKIKNKLFSPNPERIKKEVDNPS